MAIDEEVADDLISMGSREVHRASHVERPARIQWYQSKARRTKSISVSDYSSAPFIAVLTLCLQ